MWHIILFSGNNARDIAHLNNNVFHIIGAEIGTQCSNAIKKTGTCFNVTKTGQTYCHSPSTIWNLKKKLFFKEFHFLFYNR